LYTEAFNGVLLAALAAPQSNFFTAAGVSFIFLGASRSAIKWTVLKVPFVLEQPVISPPPILKFLRFSSGFVVTVLEVNNSPYLFNYINSREKASVF
jgi:hypothetical protein